MSFIRKKYVGERLCVQKNVQELHIRKKYLRGCPQVRGFVCNRIVHISKNYLRGCPQVRVIGNTKLAGALWNGKTGRLGQYMF